MPFSLLNLKSEQNPPSVYETRGFGLSNINYGMALDMGLVRGGVNEHSALGLSSVWCAVKVISEAVGSLPVHLYSISQPERKRETENPLAALLADPCPDMTRPVFYETLQSHALLWGTALAEIVRGEDGTPQALYPVHPCHVQARRNDGGQLLFDLAYPDVTKRTIPAEDMVVIPGLSPDGSLGHRLLDIARQGIGFGLEAVKHGNAMFRNMVRPSGVLEYPDRLPDSTQEKMRRSWSELFSGENVGLPALVQEGVKFIPFVNPNNEQTQYVEILQFIVYEVARYFNIPPTKLHSIQSATYSGNLEILNSEFVQTCLGPWITKWEAELERNLSYRVKEACGKSSL